MLFRRTHHIGKYISLCLHDLRFSKARGLRRHRLRLCFDDAALRRAFGHFGLRCLPFQFDLALRRRYVRLRFRLFRTDLRFGTDCPALERDRVQIAQAAEIRIVLRQNDGRKIKLRYREAVFLKAGAYLLMERIRKLGYKKIGAGLF